nr:hypothetical protein [Lachnospiraceae bacterium]
DAAHGAHLGFSDAFPESAIFSGADVVITGIHKTMPAMTQTSLIHISNNCPSKERIRRMLSVFMTSSPSYVLMASIDSMTELISKRGEELFMAYAKRLDSFYKKAEEFECLSVLTDEKLNAKGSAGHDKGKLVISDMTGTFSGKDIEEILRSRYGIESEMSAEQYVILMTSIADNDEAFEHLIGAILEIDESLSEKRIIPKTRGIFKRIYDSTIGKLAATYAADYEAEEEKPRELSCGNMKSALFDDEYEYIPPELSEGRISKDSVIIYPPGTPVTLPGCRIGGEEADKILEALKNGLEVIGLRDGEIAVLWEKSST